MGVTDREVVETPVRGGAARDGEVRLVTLDVEGLTVHQADPNALVARRALRQGGREIGLPRSRRARGGEHHGAIPQGQFPALAVHDVDIGRQAGAERVGRVVERFRHQRIVIAGQQDHGPRPVAVRELTEHAAPPRLVGRRVVEEIARAEHGIDVPALGEIQDPADGVEPRAGELLFLVALEGGETASEVPVGGV